MTLNFPTDSFSGIPQLEAASRDADNDKTHW